jgi:hypothetical protein
MIILVARPTDHRVAGHIAGGQFRDGAMLIKWW